jgi:hypothetical protein
MTLSQRIAAAQGPDSKLFFEVWNACHAGQFLNEPAPQEYFDGRKRFSTLVELGAWLDAALTIVQPALQAHVMHEAMKLLGPRGEIVGKYPEQLACAICEMAMKERGL